MPQILAPGLVVLRSLAKRLAVSCEQMPDAVRIVVGQARVLEGLPEDLPDRRGVAPELPIKACCFELTCFATYNQR